MVKQHFAFSPLFLHYFLLVSSISLCIPLLTLLSFIPACLSPQFFSLSALSIISLSPLCPLFFIHNISPFQLCSLLFYFPFTSKPPLHYLSSLCLLSSSLFPSLFKTSISQGQVELMVFLTSLNLLLSSLCRHTHVHKHMHTLPEGIVSIIDLCAQQPVLMEKLEVNLCPAVVTHRC